MSNKIISFIALGISIVALGLSVVPLIGSNVGTLGYQNLFSSYSTGGKNNPPGWCHIMAQHKSGLLDEWMRIQNMREDECMISPQVETCNAAGAPDDNDPKKDTFICYAQWTLN